MGWLLATYGFVLRLRHQTDVKLYAYAGTIMAGIQVFFPCDRELCGAAVRAAPWRAFLRTATDSTRCSSIPKW